MNLRVLWSRKSFDFLFLVILKLVIDKWLKNDTFIFRKCMKPDFRGWIVKIGIAFRQKSAVVKRG